MADKMKQRKVRVPNLVRRFCELAVPLQKLCSKRQQHIEAAHSARGRNSKVTRAGIRTAPKQIELERRAAV